MHWNIHTTDAQNIFLHVLELHGCHHQGVFTVVRVVLLKWSTVCTSHTFAHESYALAHKFRDFMHLLCIYSSACKGGFMS